MMRFHHGGAASGGKRGFVRPGRHATLGVSTASVGIIIEEVKRENWATGGKRRSDA